MIKSAALSDVGKKRKANQDRYLENSKTGLYLVADGMGGHAAGAEAAQLTVTTIDDFIRPADVSQEISWPFGYDIQMSFERNVLRTALLLANLRVCHTAELTEHLAGMGSTLVAVWIRGNGAFWAHVGDSRLYLLRSEQLQQLTEDHTLVQEQLKQGIITSEEAKTHSLRHIVTRSVGNRDHFTVEVKEQPLEAGDLLLLCCDGLTDKVETEELRRILLNGEDLEATCRALVDAANNAGGDDNITVVLLRYDD
jgi:serine/threonine protein phosphatase PrpC